MQGRSSRSRFDGLRSFDADGEDAQPRIRAGFGTHRPATNACGPHAGAEHRAFHVRYQHHDQCSRERGGAGLAVAASSLRTMRAGPLLARHDEARAERASSHRRVSHAARRFTMAARRARFGPVQARGGSSHVIRHLLSGCVVYAPFQHGKSGCETRS